MIISVLYTHFNLNTIKLILKMNGNKVNLFLNGVNFFLKLNKFNGNFKVK